MSDTLERIVELERENEQLKKDYDVIAKLSRYNREAKERWRDAAKKLLEAVVVPTDDNRNNAVENYKKTAQELSGGGL